MANDQNNRPRGREKHLSGPAKTVEKRGQGLGTGPVGAPRPGSTGGGPGAAGGGSAPGARQGGGGRAPQRNGATRLIILALVLLLGGGGGLSAFLGGQSGGQTGQTGQAGQAAPAAGGQTGGQTQQAAGSAVDWASLLGGLGGGSVSSGWQTEPNTGRLDTSVASGARARYTALRGGGRDTATIMVYMCGTDLESRSGMGTSDLNEMLAARFGSEINLLVYTGGCNGWRNETVSSRTNQIWQVKDGKLVNLQKDLGSKPMTDPATLAGYIEWCAKNYPASRYELILWDHGGGSVSGYGYDEKFARSGSMDLAGLGRALKTAGVQFDFIGFDACLMATAETALALTPYADYLIASEETEPGVGWYYTDWLTAFGKNPSMPTIELGQQIADSFVDTCAAKCPGQLTTLSVLDLAELEATLPDALAAFSRAASGLIRDKDYQTLSNARSGAREFAQSSKIDQVDLVHLAQNLEMPEADSLAEVLLSAVKYNRTSSNMTNAYGVSIFFPYRKASSVDKAVSTYEQIGMDDDYARCIQQFAALEVSGQAAAGGTASPLPALLGQLSGGSGSSGGGELVSALLEGFLGGDVSSISGLTSGNTGFLSGKALTDEETTAYLTEHRFDAGQLTWQTGESGQPVLRLSEEQWALVDSLELNLFYDDGAGYIDLGLDNLYEFDDEGGLMGAAGDSWLAIEGQPVAYYHTATVDDGAHYSITGRVPVLHNGARAELILTFDDAHPAGFVAGVQAVYPDGETETVAKPDAGLQPGDELIFLCDYYSYEGAYQDSYQLGDALTVADPDLAVSDVPLSGSTQATYRFTDLYGQQYWTEPVPGAGE